MALGSAAVMAIYAAGYARTKPAADRMAAESAAGERRRPVAPEASLSPGVAPVGQVAVAALEKSPIISEKPANVGAKLPDTVAASPTVKQKAKPVAVVSDSAKSTESSTQHSTSPVTADANSAAHAAPAAASVTIAVGQGAATSAPPTSDPPSAPPSSASPTPPAPATPPKPVYVDGVYTGRGRSRHGDIEAMVEIKDGRIVGAVISQCLTRYSCSWVSHLLPQVVSRQSAEVDYVSGATESANALYYAVLQALTQAK